MAERVFRPIRNLLKKPVFIAGKASEISELPPVTKQYNNNTNISSTKMTLIEAFKKVNEKAVFSNLQNRQKI